MVDYPVYIINLKRRKKRKNLVLKEFEGKPEFKPIIIEAVEHEIGALGLWVTIKSIIENIALNSDSDFIIVCEDDHEFTKDYDKEILFSAIQQATGLDAEFLCGGVSFLSTGFSVSNNLIWMEFFSGLQFTIIFRSFYRKILDADFAMKGAADTLFSVIGDRKFCIYPYISVQADYGYSDVTLKNNGIGRVKGLFERSLSKAHTINYLTRYWLKVISSKSILNRNIRYDDRFRLVCFIVDTEPFNDGSTTNTQRFLDKGEFSARVMNCQCVPQFDEEIPRVIKEIIKAAISEDIRAVGISFNFHEFSSHYNRHFLLENIHGAYNQGCEMLAGGTSNFDIAVPVSPNRFWMNRLVKPSFFIIYETAFSKIIETDCEKHEPYYLWLSRILTNKMCMYPFISNSEVRIDDYVQSDMESSSTMGFNRTIDRLKIIQEKFNKYCVDFCGIDKPL